MEIDKMEFNFWMKRIMERFDVLGDQLSSSNKQLNAIDGEELLDNQEVLQKLKISTRSLQRYRSSGQLPYFTISGKLYYKLSDVQQFIRSSFSSSVERLSKTKRDK
ncbi:helix-turn-helix domain-containing protein [Chryseobacterium sp. ISL-6]|uniref:helix-turn-helix domain-containing protein n=1 Tax=Chryseobacterium sp. ISL-6 TaxID=2819143 RepID=UPI001BEA4C0F|nr:helix-turn-helix domain-containing protein [Chryseobacterium sp. ISL-6]MBT2621864.1 helix-turn-helix domain-containing protein [Chryseobacterium sp. ISL-6]